MLLNMKLNDILIRYNKISKNDIIYLLRYKYNCDISDILTMQNLEIDESSLDSDIRRLLTNEPIQYIVGSVDFFGCRIDVGQGVLIPRLETEYLVDILKKEALFEKHVLDLCCGSGAIGISIAKNYGAKVTCVDINDDAVYFTQKNAILNNINIEVIKSDLFEKCSKKYDLIISNPPYIPTCDIEELNENVKNFEPKIALDGGEDGLDFYRRILMDIGNYIVEGGIIYFEIGYNQGEALKKMMKNDFLEVEVLPDLQGRDRIVRGKYRKKNV